MEVFAINMNIQMEGPAQFDSRGISRTPAATAKVVQAADSPPREVSDQEIEHAKKVLENRFNVQMVLTQDEETGRSVVKILSPDGERVLRQMPPDAAIELAEAAQRGYADGILASVV